MKKQIKELILKSDIRVLITLSAVSPLIHLMVWDIIMTTIFDGPIPESIDFLGILLCAPLWGLAGLFQVMKEEVPIILGRTIKGEIAVAIGLLLTIFIWGLCLFAWCLYVAEYIIGN